MKNRTAFSLAELIVIIVALGLISALVISGKNRGENYPATKPTTTARPKPKANQMHCPKCNGRGIVRRPEEEVIKNRCPICFNDPELKPICEKCYGKGRLQDDGTAMCD